MIDENIAPSIWRPHPYTECSAYPLTMMSIKPLMNLKMMKMESIPALIDPNSMNPFHILFIVDCAIFSSECSSRSPENEMEFGSEPELVISLAISCMTAGFSAGNMI